MRAPPFDRVREALAAHPLGAPIAPLFARFDADPLADVGALDRALAPVAGVRFERAAPRPSRARRRPAFSPAEGYDGRITLAGVVPTRPGSLHDLLNALVWCALPTAKRALHARQHALVAARGGKAPARTREEDALALVDEGGAVVVAAPGRGAEVAEAVFSERAGALAALAARGHARGILFGHALYEHLALGVEEVRASVPLVVEAGPEVELATADAALARELRDPSALRDPAALARASLRALAGLDAEVS